MHLNMAYLLYYIILYHIVFILFYTVLLQVCLLSVELAKLFFFPTVTSHWKQQTYLNIYFNYSLILNIHSLHSGQQYTKHTITAYIFEFTAKLSRREWFQVEFVCGILLVQHSNSQAGKQSVPKDTNDIRFGSVTHVSCWEEKHLHY